MKLKSVEYLPVAVIELTPADLEILIACSRAHYDYTCRSAGEHVGFLYGMEQRAKHVPGCEHHLDRRHMDTLCKIIETLPYISVAEGLRRLAVYIRHAFTLMNRDIPEARELT